MTSDRIVEENISRRYYLSKMLLMNDVRVYTYLDYDHHTHGDKSIIMTLFLGCLMFSQCICSRPDVFRPL